MTRPATYDVMRDHLTHYIDKRSFVGDPPTQLIDSIGGVSNTWANSTVGVVEWIRDTGQDGNACHIAALNLTMDTSPGEYRKVGLTDDMIVMFVGSSFGSETESSAIFRFGESNGGGNPAFRARVVNDTAGWGQGPAVPGQLIDSDISAGMQAYQTDVRDDNVTPFLLPSTIFEEHEIGMCAIALDRSGVKLHSHQFSFALDRSRYDGGNLPSIDASGFTTLSLQNEDNAGTTNSWSIQHHIYAGGLYIFPDKGLPADWRGLCERQGRKWLEGEFDNPRAFATGIATAG